MAEPVPQPAAEPAPVPWYGPFVLAAFVGLVVCTNVASAVWARWVDTRPEELLLLSARNRYLALTLAADVPLWAYVVIGTLRLLVAFAVCHLIGRAFGDRALGWFTRYLGVTNASIAQFQRGYGKAEWVLVPFFAGSNIVAVISGVHRSSPLRLAALLAVGIAGRLLVIWWLARTFEEQLVDFLGWLQRYQLWAIVISVAFVILVNLRNLRRGRA